MSTMQNGSSERNGSLSHYPNSNGVSAATTHEDEVNGRSVSNGSTPINGAHAPNGDTGPEEHASHNGVPYMNGNADANHGNDFPVAICGMALRLPGGIATPQDFWEFLLNKGDSRGRVPESRYNVSAFYSDSGKPGDVVTEYGYFLDESVKLGSLDASRFSMTRAELESSDPQQRLMLEVVREALDDAGEVNFKGTLTGCYMGTYGEDWLELQNRDNQQMGPYRVDGYSDFMLSSRVSYEMDFKGPSLNIRTACSAALTGFHEACVAMQRGDCNAAVVGGSSLIMSPSMTQFMSEKGVLSPDGSCKTFSADANGYARGEAVNAVYIKPLDAAIRDGNPVRAVIRATAANHDGRTPGLSQPSSDSQEAMIRRAYKSARITNFSQTGFVECHGTGTPVGDPIETNAVARVFGEAGVHIGSVKPNVGHSEGASGLTSLIKSVLSLEHQTIPPNIKFTSPNPKIAFDEAKLTVPVEPTAWPENRCERASVNSFGIGGSNAHVILDSARSFNVPKPAPKGYVTNRSHLLLLSANSANALTNMTKSFQGWMPLHAERLEDVSYTLAHRREWLPHRGFVVASTDRPEGSASEGRKIPSQTPNLVMVFTGQGAQWPRMGRELFQRAELPFQQSIKSLDKYLQAAPNAPIWTLEAELLKPARNSKVQTAELSQPLCTAVQIALVDLFFSLGVKPQAVVGHSSGEIAAAYASGALSAKEAIIAAWQRGLYAMQQTKLGAMAAVGLSWDEVSPFLRAPKVVVACENSPRSVTLSGDANEVQDAIIRIKKAHPDVTARLLKVDKAYHSNHMREVGGDYGEALASQITGKSPSIPFFSSVTGTGRHEDDMNAKYWQRNLESPVLFNSAVSGVLANVKDVAFLELGPHPALAGPVRQILTARSTSAPYIGAMNRGEDTVESFFSAVGTLFELGIPVDFEKLIPAGTCLPDLPRYPWDHKSDYWKESRMSHEWRKREFPAHPLLGIRQLEGTSLEPSFRNKLQVANTHWLRDHQVEERMVFPCAGYVAMIGEGVRQITGLQKGFVLRNVTISAALVLSEDSTAEMVTTFRPVRLTDSLDSEWWDFSISSHNGNAWQKNFAGEVHVLTDESEPVASSMAQQLPRKLDTRKYYDTFSRVGMGYGPCFQLLDNISAGTMDCDVAGQVLKSTCGDEKHYYIHPTVLDAALQTSPLAATKGRIDQKQYRRVPTKIEKMTVYRCDSDQCLDVQTHSRPIKGSGDVLSDIRCSANGKVLLDIENITSSVLQEAETLEDDKPLTAARLAWRPHIDFFNAKDLVKPAYSGEPYHVTLRDLLRLCLVFSQRRGSQAVPVSSHLATYKEWIQREVQSYGADPIVNMEDAAIQAKIECLVQSLVGTPAEACAVALQNIQNNIEQLLSGQRDASELLMTDGTLDALFSLMNSVDHTQFIRHLAHTKPNLRILEVGAGTGASTAALLRELALPTGQPLFSKYTFTDISSDFSAAKDRFKDYQNIEYRVLDVSKDPAEQGFGADETYDLVVANNVFHLTKNLGETLGFVSRLICPGGRLLLQELNPSLKWPNYLFGLFSSWWLGGNDGRIQEPYVKPSRWEHELLRAGFAEEEVSIQDAQEPHQLNSFIIAKMSSKDKPQSMNQSVSVLCDEEQSGFQALSQSLEAHGLHGRPYKLDDIADLPEGQDIISLLDISQPFLHNIDEMSFKAFQLLIERLGNMQSGLFWVTKSSQVDCQDPSYAQIIGTARTIRNEALVDFATCEVDDFASSLDKVVQVFAKFQAEKSAKEELLNPDYDYAISKGVVNISRLYPFSLTDQLQSDIGQEEHVALDMGQVGRLNTLQWTSKEKTTLEGDDVEVQVHAAGLNFKDILCAVSVLEYPEQGLGVESSGVVCRVGPEVKGIRVGDRVMMTRNGSFASHVVASERICVKIPDRLSFEDAASMPAVYGTAVYGLLHLGALKNGQSVLIHSACGGVGLAAMQVAQMIGAEIYGTVGNEEKVNYLVEKFGLPRERIFNSRDTSFVEGVVRETNGRGVDVALNSLSGELLHATWRCISEFGKMVDIGKRDFVGAAKLDMGAFLLMRTYTSFDLVALVDRAKLEVQALLKEIVEYYEQGHITPIMPRTTFKASAIQEAFRYMQQGQHTGKIVISMRDPQDHRLNVDLNSVKAPMRWHLDPEASYLLVGGLGGLGRGVARHLIEHNARRLVFFSRSAGTNPEDAGHVKELESMGCDIRLVQGSVTNPDDVSRVISETTNLKGIFQCSMVLRDENFARMTLNEWTTANDPKVKGTWNLHMATLAADVQLDFFVMFSSVSGLFGQVGQANYAGANTFLDAFAQYRQSLGLAGSSIEIGPVQDIGFLSHNSTLLQRITSGGAHAVTAPELMEAITAAAILSPPGNSGNQSMQFVAKNVFTNGISTAGSLSGPDSRFAWGKDKRTAIYHNLSDGYVASSSSKNDGLKSFLSKAKVDADMLRQESTAAFLAQEIGAKLFEFLLKSDDEVNTTVPLARLGLDSLVAVEMRSWWRQAFAFDISVLELLGMGNLDSLGRFAADGLLKKLSDE